MTSRRFQQNIVLIVPMIAALRHGQVSRTFEEDDELQVIQEPEVKLRLVLRPAAAIAGSYSAIFSVGPASRVLAQSIVKSCSTVPLGEVVSEDDKQCFATVHANTVNVLFVLLTQSVPENLSFAFTELFDVFDITNTIILDSVSISTYVGRGEEGALRKMSSTNSEANINAATVPTLAIGNLVTGISAALLNRAEARNKSVVLYTVLSRVYLSGQAMKAYEALLPVFSTLLGTTVQAPDAADYSAILKRDPYVMKTENLYS